MLGFPLTRGAVAGRVALVVSTLIGVPVAAGAAESITLSNHLSLSPFPYNVTRRSRSGKQKDVSECHAVLVDDRCEGKEQVESHDKAATRDKVD